MNKFRFLCTLVLLLVGVAGRGQSIQIDSLSSPIVCDGGLSIYYSVPPNTFASTCLFHAKWNNSVLIGSGQILPGDTKGVIYIPNVHGVVPVGVGGITITDTCFAVTSNSINIGKGMIPFEIVDYLPSGVLEYGTCAGNQISLKSSPSNLGPNTVWTANSVLFDTTSTITDYPTVTTTYVLSAQDAYLVCPAKFDTATVVVHPDIHFTLLTPDTSFCNFNGDSLLVQATVWGGSGSYWFAWDGFTSTTDTFAYYDYTWTSIGPEIWTFEVVGDQYIYDCPIVYVDNEMYISMQNPLTIEPQLTDTVCYGNYPILWGLTLGGGTGLYYDFSISPSLDSALYSSQDYIMTLADTAEWALCPTVIDTFHVAVQIPPVPSIWNNNGVLTCTITAYDYDWFRDGIGVGSGQTHVPMSPGAYTVTTQNPPHWCNATSEPYMVVSTEDARSEGLAMIYPNPVTQTLYIQWGKSALEPTELVLTDLSGKVLYHTYVEAPLPYEVFPLALPSTVASGTYLLLLRTATAQLREKIVVER